MKSFKGFCLGLLIGLLLGAFWYKSHKAEWEAAIKIADQKVELADRLRKQTEIEHQAAMEKTQKELDAARVGANTALGHVSELNAGLATKQRELQELRNSGASAPQIIQNLEEQIQFHCQIEFQYQGAVIFYQHMDKIRDIREVSYRDVIEFLKGSLAARDSLISTTKDAYQGAITERDRAVASAKRWRVVGLGGGAYILADVLLGALKK